MTATRWTLHTPVVLCGIHEGKITEDGTGVERFATLEAARKVFPELEPDQPTARFTQATLNPRRHEIRFETHQAEQFYSSQPRAKKLWPSPAYKVRATS